MMIHPVTSCLSFILAVNSPKGEFVLTHGENFSATRLEGVLVFDSAS